VASPLNTRLFPLLIGTLALLDGTAHGQTGDRTICNRIFSRSFEHALINKPIGEIVAAVGKEFLGAPYEAHTLDGPGEERLVADLRSFDCVTFVENVSALSRCIKRNRLSFDAYLRELERFRYRAGAVDGYASRLHYFTEWIADNETKGIVKDITRELGGEPVRKPLDFMTSHRASYPKLAADSVYTLLREVEDTLRGRVYYHIPKSRIAAMESRIQTGDIIAMTTSVKGLDVSHTGIAVRLEDRTLHYLHAPNVHGAVRLSAETLAAHLLRFPSYTGIIVARLVEPNE
jgi:hypothetical protein